MFCIGLASWLMFVMFNCTFATFPCGILGQVWNLFVLIPDLCPLSYSIYGRTGKIFLSETIKPRALIFGM